MKKILVPSLIASAIAAHQIPSRPRPNQPMTAAGRSATTAATSPTASPMAW